jgi:hypothetical protein
MTVYAWSTTAATNATADTTVNWAEGQLPSTVNDSARAMMARWAAWLDQIGGTVTYGGSSNAYTATSPSGHALTAYAAGNLYALKANHTNTGPCTINIDGLGVKSIVTPAGAALDASAIVSGGVYLLVYDGTSFQVVGLLAAPPIHNRFFNGDNQIDLRNAGAAQTITAGAALAYTIDRWYAYCTGANVTGQQIAGSGSDLFRYRFTGAVSVTTIGFSTRIEARDSADMAGGAATIAVELANSLLTTVTWTAWYANTTDTFGTLASPTRTSIATGTFTVTSTLTTYTATISVPSAATTGIEVEFSVAAQTSGTWTIGKRGIVKGSAWTGFAPRPFAQELDLCRRYARSLTHEQRLNSSAASNFWAAGVPLSPPMRATPTATQIAAGTLSNLSAATCVPGSAEIVQLNATTTAAGDAFVTGRTYLLSAEL